MTIPVWPTSLNQIERSGWQAQMQDARRGRQSDAGPPGWRRRFSSAARLVALSLVTDRNGKAVFDNFYEDTCAQGSLPFWMPDPTTHGWPLLTGSGVPLLTADGTPLLIGAMWLCTFGEQVPVETIEQHVEFRKTFSVAVLP